MSPLRPVGYGGQPARKFLTSVAKALACWNRTVRSFEAGSLPELAVALVKARIAKGWSQRRLAEELGIAEQQIQRYEATGSGSASLARLCDIVAALGVDVHEVVSLPSTDAA
jgi:ribosome-binding protein aMBF1 (putative translation factor)